MKREKIGSHYIIDNSDKGGNNHYEDRNAKFIGDPASKREMQKFDPTKTTETELGLYMAGSKRSAV